MQNKFEVPVYNSESGYSLKGIDLGSNNFRINKPVKVALLIGDGVNFRSYRHLRLWYSQLRHWYFPHIYHKQIEG